MFIIPALGSLKQKNSEFEANQGFIARTCLKKKQKEYFLFMKADKNSI
jgi:hypothetical protein